MKDNRIKRIWCCSNCNNGFTSRIEEIPLRCPICSSERSNGWFIGFLNGSLFESKEQRCKYSGIYCSDCANPNCKDRIQDFDYLANVDPHDLTGHVYICEDGEEFCIHCLKSRYQIEKKE